MKSINDFLDILEDELKYLNPKDAREVLIHYRDKINIASDYGDSEEKILASLPDPKKIAEDIYKSKGVDYLNIRKKKIKRNLNIKAILSCLMLVFVISGLFVIGYYLSVSVINLFSLMIKTFDIDNFVDIASISLFILTYILILLIGMIYIFDLLYIIGCFFLQNIFDAWRPKLSDKNFLDFSLSAFIEEKFKKEKLVVKTLIVTFVCFLVFGLGNYLVKGYIYRSMNEQVRVEENLDIPGEIKKISIKNSKAIVRIKESSEILRVNVNYGSEFNSELEYSVSNNELVIENIKSSSYDFLNILDEPLMQIEILIPTTMDVEDIYIEMYDSYIDLAYIEQNVNVEVKSKHTTFAMTECNVTNCIVEGSYIESSFEKNNINDMNLKMTSGKYYCVDNKYGSMNIDNWLGEIIMQGSYIQNAIIKCQSTKVAFHQVNINSLNYTDANSESYFYNLITNEASFSSIGNSNITLDKLLAYSNVTLITDIGYINASYLKAPNIMIDNKNGTVNFYNTNQTINSNSDDEDIKYMVDLYNNKTFEVIVDISSTKGKVDILNGNITTCNMELNNTTVLVNSTKILTTNVSFTESTLNISDLDGNTIDVYVNGGSLIFYNDNIISDIILTVTGEKIKTSIEVSSSIARGDI